MRYILYTQENNTILALLKYWFVTSWHNVSEDQKVRTVFTFCTDIDVKLSLMRDAMEHNASYFKDDRWIEGSPRPMPVFLYKSDAKYASRIMGIPFVRKWYPVYD